MKRIIRWAKLMYEFHKLSNHQKQMTLGIRRRIISGVKFYGKWSGRKFKVNL